MPAPTIDPTTIAVRANSDNFCVELAATLTHSGGPSLTAARVSSADPRRGRHGLNPGGTIAAKVTGR